jgi:hypothetical protein
MRPWCDVNRYEETAVLHKLEMTQVINAPANRVWDVISDFQGVKNWMTPVAKSVPETAGNEVGAAADDVFERHGLGSRSTRRPRSQPHDNDLFDP